MKNRIAIGGFYVIAALILAVGPQTFLKVCDTSKMVMKCHWAAGAEAAIGIILLAAGILYLLPGQKETKLAVSLFGLVTGITAILVTIVLIGGCDHAGAVCRDVSFPVLNTVSTLSILASAGNILYLLLRKKKAGKRGED
jgi:hypothetical protein